MGVNLIRILTLATILTRALGTNRLVVPHHYYRHPMTLHTFKEVSSPVVVLPKGYDFELLKPMSQMPQRRHVPLYLISQNLVHINPSATKNFPAIEIPLTEPMVVTGPTSDIMAPVGFNVFFRGSFCHFYTMALIAPVPPGTHPSIDSPVIVNHLYAIPKLPQYPVSQGIRTKPNEPPKQIQVTGPDTDSDTISLDDTVTVPLNDDVNDQISFENAKESPYLQELRLESLQRQVQELQAKIRKLKRLRS